MGVARIRILVTGSRMWSDVDCLTEALDDATVDYNDVTIVHGRCDPRTPDGDVVMWDEAMQSPLDGLLGADWWAHRHALRRHWHVEPHQADWSSYGLRAGGMRNRIMVKRGADRCLGFPLRGSKGTLGCLKLALDAHIPVATYPR